MSRRNKVNPGQYTAAGRLSPDDLARERRKQAEQLFGGSTGGSKKPERASNANDAPLGDDDGDPDLDFGDDETTGEADDLFGDAGGDAAFEGSDDQDLAGDALDDETAGEDGPVPAAARRPAMPKRAAKAKPAPPAPRAAVKKPARPKKAAAKKTAKAASRPAKRAAAKRASTKRPKAAAKSRKAAKPAKKSMKKAGKAKKGKKAKKR
jgi:hypothetical protein